MTNIVLRTGINIYKHFLLQLESKVTRDCICNINANDYQTYSAKLSSRPMFSKRYIVYATVDKLETKYINYLAEITQSRWIQLIIKVRSRDIFESLKYNKLFSSFVFLDCYTFTKETMNRYIVAELRSNGCPEGKITKAAVTRIRRRARYKEYVLDSVLPILAQTDMSLKTINSYIEPYSGVTLQNIGSKLFDREKSGPVADLIFSYRNYITIIYKQICEYVKTWLQLYGEYSQGSFSEDNLLSWISERGSAYNISFDYQAKSWLDSFSRYSYAFMSLVFITLQEVAHASNSEQFLAVYKVYRMVNK